MYTAKFEKSKFKANKLFNLDYKYTYIFMLFASVYLMLCQGFCQFDKAYSLSYFTSPTAIILNTLIPFMFILFFYFIFGNVWSGITFTSLFMYICLFINHYKVFFRDEPFKPSDLVLGTEAFDITKNYKLNFSTALFFTLIFLAILIVFSIVFVKVKSSRKWYYRVSGAILTLALMVFGYNKIIRNMNVYNSVDKAESINSEVAISVSHGFVYSFAYGLNGHTYTQPENYSKEKVSNILKEYPDNTLAEKNNNTTPVNVIAIQSEAFFDVTEGGTAEFYEGKDPYKEFHEIQKDSLYGNIIVPGFAGSTESTEFEYLSGASLPLVSKSLPSVYRSYIIKNIYGLPRLFKNKGYENIAIHPGKKWFYNRENVYRRMGFDKFITESDLPEDTPRINWYVTDKVASNLIIENYKNHLKSAPEQGYFNFTVTIQNHGPYSEKDESRDKILKPIDGMNDNLYNVANNYFNGVYDAQMLLYDVTEFVKTLDQPTVVVFWGDHLPYLDSEFQCYSYLGYDVSGTKLSDLEKKHSTPFVIWGNDALKKQLNEQNADILKGNFGDISSNFLSSLTLDYANIGKSPYFSFVNDLMKDVKVITSNYYYTDDYVKELSDNLNSKINDYSILQYDNIVKYKDK